MAGRTSRFVHIRAPGDGAKEPSVGIGDWMNLRPSPFQTRESGGRFGAIAQGQRVEDNDSHTQAP
jgi:hypothetical protein